MSNINHSFMEDQNLHFPSTKVEIEDINDTDVQLTIEEPTINLDDYEVMAINTQVIVLPYKENPYKEIQKTDSGLILGVDSHKYFKNTDSGEIEEATLPIKFGKVISAGPECKYVKVGQDILYNARIQVPVPFGKKGYYSTTEQNVCCIIKKKE